MKTDKKYKILTSAISQLIIPIGSCLASDKITVDGESISYMYRETPSFKTDCGWRFFSGSESQEYVDNADNLAYYDVNTIANYDRSIIPYLDLPVGSELSKLKNSETFVLINGSTN